MNKNLEQRSEAIKNIKSSDWIDWDEVLINASIAAMQGIQETDKIGLVGDFLPEQLADRSVKIGKAIVERLKEEIDKQK